jgi:ribonuclease Z
MRVVAVAALAASACLLASCVERRVRAELTRADGSLLTAPGMTLVLCGTGTWLADPERAGPCTAIVAAGRVYLVDVGPGAWESLNLHGVPVDALRIVFLTKLLSDDTADLGEAITRSWLSGRRDLLDVAGPPGTARLVADVVDALHFDVAMRSASHRADVLRPDLAGARARELALAEPEGAIVALDEDGLRVTAFTLGVEGGVTRTGYRFDYRGRSIVIGGHARGNPNLVRVAAGADVLVQEAASPAMLERGATVMTALGQERWAIFTRDGLPWNPSPIDAAEAARAAGVHRLVLTRLYPPPTTWIERWAFMRGVRDVFPNAQLGEDGMRVRLDPRL